MQNTRNAHFCDLGEARRLALALAAPPSATAPPTAGPAITAWSSGPPPSWSQFVTQVAAAYSADAAFVVDRAGLLVSAFGPTEREIVQAIGSRLSIAFDHALMLAHGPKQHAWLHLPLERGTLTALGYSGFVLAVSAPLTLNDTQRHQLAHAFERQLAPRQG